MSRYLAPCLALVALVAWPERGYGHGIHLFASANGRTITGYAYASGGGKIGHAQVGVLGADGRKLGEATTDAGGGFTFEAKTLCDHRFVIETGDGHRAEFTVRAQELGAGAPAGQAAEPEPQHSAVSRVADATSAPRPADVEGLVARAVARQIGPLRADMERLRSRVMIRDVIGGIGYILGIMALVFYVKGRWSRGQ